MDVVCTVSSLDWELVIRGNRVPDRQKKLGAVLEKRGIYRLPASSIRFSRPVVIKQARSCNYVQDYLGISVSSLALNRPIFFENTEYVFDFHFKNTLSDIGFHHSLARIQDCFYIEKGRFNDSLRGAFNFGNDLGWFYLPISYVKDGQRVALTLSFEVWPIKMDMLNDLQKIYTTLDATHPLLRFSFARSTQQGFQRNRRIKHNPFELLWIAEFEALHQQLLTGFRRIIQAPHKRLLTDKKYVKADRLKGRLPHKLAANVKESIQVGDYQKRYLISQKKLSVDTPENQFIKHVLDYLLKKLARFEHKAHGFSELSSGESKLTDSFFKQLRGLGTPFSKIKSNAFFKEIGNYSGLKEESLVLQQKTGYSLVYKSWQDLSAYLDVLGSDANISTKTVADLYEVWCFLEIGSILKSAEFGFKALSSNEPNAQLDKHGLEYKVAMGADQAFKYYKEFANGEKITITLRHEKRFSGGKNSPTKKQGIVSWLTDHKPDIYLEVNFPCGEQFIWLFDAKYRIDLDKNDQDWVPQDAIYQMHRYRDALIYQRRDDTSLTWLRSRPIFGAYALYPGYYVQQNRGGNPYHDAIEDIDIGAFPFLPNSDNSWLRGFLKDMLLGYQAPNLAESGADAYNNSSATFTGSLKKRPSSKISSRY